MLTTIQGARLKKYLVKFADALPSDERIAGVRKQLEAEGVKYVMPNKLVTLVGLNQSLLQCDATRTATQSRQLAAIY